MMPLRPFFLAALWLPALASPSVAQDSSLLPPPPLLAAFAEKAADAQKRNATTVVGTDGWLFLASELRFLSFGHFWGAEAVKVSRAPKPELADPLPAIVDFQKQLKARGIDLLLVPVPPKAAFYTGRIFGSAAEGALRPLRSFFAELPGQGVEVLDLSGSFEPEAAAAGRPQRTGMYCQTDTHWSPTGCAVAASQIASWLEKKLGPSATPNPFRAASAEVEFEGDLVALLPKGAPRPAKEKLHLQQVSTVAGQAVEPDPASPVLLMGDSHTLVFHDFAGERGGLLDQLALARGAAPDLIGTRGSGSTAVRLSLYRRSIKDPAYLAKKKVVVWCFAAREFTESDQGWAKLPIAK